MTAPRGSVPPLRSAGVWTMVLGVLHMATVGVFYRESVRSIREGGIGSVDADPTLVERRGVGFWYLTSGILVTGLGAIVRASEKTHGRPPAGTAALLAATAAWGAALTPKSPFWFFLPIAWLARSAAKRLEGATSSPRV